MLSALQEIQRESEQCYREGLSNVAALASEQGEPGGGFKPSAHFSMPYLWCVLVVYACLWARCHTIRNSNQARCDILAVLENGYPQLLDAAQTAD